MLRALSSTTRILAKRLTPGFQIPQIGDVEPPYK
jgi:hypothetical protein